MEPGAKRPMVIAAIAILLLAVVLLKGVAPLVRFQIIPLLMARLRHNRRAHGAASTNDPSTVPGPFRRNRLVVAIFGAPSTVDVEQARSAPPPFADFSISAASLARPPPVYTHRHHDNLYSGNVVYYATPGHNVVAVPAQYPPPYASSPSLRGAPSTSTAS
ncbi:hypothetical protein FRC04_006457 [Tulasnella sp. 424]|nr:hypothetical protein FRC04_006457 [Tulasnella sp. 424]KAG8980502.1 hypothetical protein FRC05_006135 [Tulasnella sp. 425]